MVCYVDISYTTTVSRGLELRVTFRLLISITAFFID
jgi:hypothetical protein